MGTSTAKAGGVPDPGRIPGWPPMKVWGRSTAASPSAGRKRTGAALA